MIFEVICFLLNVSYDTRYVSQFDYHCFHEYSDETTLSSCTYKYNNMKKDKGKQITCANLPNAKADISLS